jgi:primosomal protein N' (replication factor Y)
MREHTAPPDVLVLGPAPAAIAQVRGRHRHHILLKAPQITAGLRRARSILIRFSTEHQRPRLTIDVDPVSLL